MNRLPDNNLSIISSTTLGGKNENAMAYFDVSYCINKNRASISLIS